jgi:hypothetical protein
MPRDVDLIVNKETFNPGFELYKNRYPGMDGKMDVLGYYPDIKRGYNVDFFHGIDIQFIECDGFKFHHPIEIMLKKLEIAPHRGRNDNKDIHDVIFFLKKYKKDFKLI